MGALARLKCLLIISLNIAYLAPGLAMADEMSIDIIQMERVQKAYKLRKKKSYDPSKFVPKMDPSRDQFQVGLKVMTHTIQNYVETQKDEEIGVDNPNRKLMTDAFESPILIDKESNQNISLRVKAADSTASVRYRGIADASVNYIIGRDAIRTDVLEQLVPGIAVMYSYLSAHDESRHTISMNFTW